MNSIDGYTLKKMIIFGANELAKNRVLVDSLNVFPVPDGDTGTNMSYTIIAAAKECNKARLDTGSVSKAAAEGSLRGARGNSGVILSQLFRGFAKGLEHTVTADVVALARAFEKATETAYKAVMKPKEGTILTIARAVSEKAKELSYDVDDIWEFLAAVLRYGLDMLAKTTEMLPELSRAKVVDAGGKGLLCILEGMLKALTHDGDIILSEYYEASIPQSLDMESNSSIPTSPVHEQQEIEFGYCTEFFIDTKFSEEEASQFIEDFKGFLTGIGDSAIVVGDSLIKVHVHTNNPGSVLEYALKSGELNQIKIENMRIQHTNLLGMGKKKPFGFVAVSMGDGLDELFKTLGVDHIIQGGQTMNPSTDEILTAIKAANSEVVFVLPNNKNIILAAKQAAELYGTSAYVLETTSIPQGISAMVAYAPTYSTEENLENMTAAVSQVKTAVVTYAVRNSDYGGFPIEENDYLFIREGKIVEAGKDMQEGSKRLIGEMVDEYSTVSIYYGNDVLEETANELAESIANEYACEASAYYGGQPLYFYIISVE